MGAAIARRFASVGMNVVLADRAAAPIEAACTELGERALAITADVTNEADVARLSERALSWRKRVDVLVTCAGISFFGRAEQTTLRDWRSQLDVNLTGTFLACREIGRTMLESGRGSIVTFGSTAGSYGVPEMAAYTASKHGVVGLTRALAVEWGRRGVRVNCICPGATLTPMLLATSDEYRAERVRRVPLGRLAEPDEQAAIAVFLASDASSNLTGCVIASDGGISALAPGTGETVLDQLGGGVA
jgi:NAD(P)-dependent dehydrogenase (short-subunit alcohol dehydrogenase family)